MMPALHKTAYNRPFDDWRQMRISCIMEAR